MVGDPQPDGQIEFFDLSETYDLSNGPPAGSGACYPSLEDAEKARCARCEQLESLVSGDVVIRRIYGASLCSVHLVIDDGTEAGAGSMVTADGEAIAAAVEMASRTRGRVFVATPV